MRLELSVRLSKGETIKPSLNSPLAGSRAWGMKTGVLTAAFKAGKGIKSPLRLYHGG